MLSSMWIEPQVWLPSTEQPLCLPWAALCLFLWEFPFDEWLQQQDCVITKRASSWSILKHLWACTLLLFGISHIPGCFPFACLGFFFFFFSYDNSEVWPKSVGVEQDQLCLRLLSNPVVSILCFPAHEGNKRGAGAGMGFCRYFLSLFSGCRITAACGSSDLWILKCSVSYQLSNSLATK